MRKCVYFVKQCKNDPPGPRLAAGYGFQRDGAWRQIPLPEDAEGLLLDDRFAPSRQGLEAAAAALAAWEGFLVLDFERPPGPWAGALAARLPARRLICPPELAELPHAAVLVGPWLGGGSFARWLETLRRRWGALLLDGAHLRRRLRPGCPGADWEGPLPDSGFPCPAALCLHRRLPDGSLLLWDTKETLTARHGAAGVPVVLFQSDWNALP